MGYIHSKHMALNGDVLYLLGLCPSHLYNNIVLHGCILFEAVNLEVPENGRS